MEDKCEPDRPSRATVVNLSKKQKSLTNKSIQYIQIS